MVKLSVHQKTAIVASLVGVGMLGMFLNKKNDREAPHKDSDMIEHYNAPQRAPQQALRSSPTRGVVKQASTAPTPIMNLNVIERNAACAAGFELIKDSNGVDCYCAPISKELSCPSGNWNVAAQRCEDAPVAKPVLTTEVPANWQEDPANKDLYRPEPPANLPVGTTEVVCPADVNGLPRYQVGTLCVTAQEKCIADGYNWDSVAGVCGHDLSTNCVGGTFRTGSVDGVTNAKTFCFKA